MTEKKKTYNVELLTPCFCHGADCQNNPEIRIASIRGQIRQWRSMRGQEKNAIEDVWGGGNKEMKASKVALEIHNLTVENFSKEPLLPHKNLLKRDAIPKGTKFTLLLRRLAGCSENIWNEAKRDVSTWLLLGGLGQRSNRAAGSVWCIHSYPDSEKAANSERKIETIEDFRNNLNVPASWDILISTTTMTSQKAWETASDTVKNEKYFGCIEPKRKPSPTKIKVVRLADKYHLLLMADKRDNARFLDEAIKKLQFSDKDGRFRERWRNLTFESLVP